MKCDRNRDLVEDPAWLSELHQSLKRWFASNGRTFPWRDTDSPYEVLVAEKLLQQTAARYHVVEAFQEFVEGYPSPSELACANVPDVEQIISQLGLANRARELKELGQQIVSKYGGEIPRDLASLKELRGVGEYIARAVLCFGFGENVAVMDTNVARWLHRMLMMQGQIPANPARNRALLELVEEIAPAWNARTFNLAVIDLGAAICVARTPRCKDCPVQHLCLYFARQPSS